MATTTKLDNDEQGKNIDTKLYCSMVDSLLYLTDSRPNIKFYRSVIGSLLYLTTSRAGIMFSVYLCARFPSWFKESHLIVVKRIIRYLKGTNGMGLWYLKSDTQ